MLAALLALTIVAVPPAAHSVDLMEYLRIVTGRMIVKDHTAEVWFQESTEGDFPIEEVKVGCVLTNRFGRPAGESVTVIQNVQNQPPVTGRPRITFAEDDGEVPKLAACRILAAR